MEVAKGSLRQVSQPTMLAVSLQSLKNQLRIEHCDDDAFLTSKLQEAISTLEADTDRQLITAQWVLTIQSWSDVIELHRCPVQSVESITYEDENGDTQTVDPSAYRLNSMCEPALISLKGEAWPTNYGLVTVSFTAGYGDYTNTVPPIARQAVLLLGSEWYCVREAVVSGVANEIPYGYQHLIDKLRWRSQLT